MRQEHRIAVALVAKDRKDDLRMAKRWYIVHAYTNFERKVADAIKERARAAGLDEVFEEVVVPTEEVVEVKRGRKVQAERKFLPGYVLVKMEMSDAAFVLIKNTPKVTRFPGCRQQADRDLGRRGRAHPRIR